jgi:imidazolonepropionase
VATTLAGRAPPVAGDADGYIRHVCEVIPRRGQEGLAEAVDVFCEGVGFSLAQTRRVFEAAQAHGLKVKGHVEQLSNLHGAALVAVFGGLSADHIEYLDDAGVAALAASGTVAVRCRASFAQSGNHRWRTALPASPWPWPRPQPGTSRLPRSGWP